MNAKKRFEIFTRLKAANPNPTTELNYRSNFELLIAVVLSAQATDKAVNQSTDKLFTVAPDPQSMLDLGIDGLREMIKSIGLFNSKAKNILSLCQILINKHDGMIPSNRVDGSTARGGTKNCKCHFEYRVWSTNHCG